VVSKLHVAQAAAPPRFWHNLTKAVLWKNPPTITLSGGLQPR